MSNRMQMTKIARDGAWADARITAGQNSQGSDLQALQFFRPRSWRCLLSRRCNGWRCGFHAAAKLCQGRMMLLMTDIAPHAVSGGAQSGTGSGPCQQVVCFSTSSWPFMAVTAPGRAATASSVASELAATPSDDCGLLCMRCTCASSALQRVANKDDFNLPASLITCPGQ